MDDGEKLFKRSVCNRLCCEEGETACDERGVIGRFNKFDDDTLRVLYQNSLLISIDKKCIRANKAGGYRATPSRGRPYPLVTTQTPDHR